MLICLDKIPGAATSTQIPFQPLLKTKPQPSASLPNTNRSQIYHFSILFSCLLNQMKPTPASPQDIQSSTFIAPDKPWLRLATSLWDALAISNTFIHKLSRTLIIPAQEISAEKAVVTLVLESLVAVEVRGWIKREFEAMITTIELMTMASLKKLAGEVVRRSQMCERFRVEK